MVKMIHVKVGRSAAKPDLIPMVRYEGSRRLIPADQTVEVPRTAYYLRALHRGDLIEVAAPEKKRVTKSTATTRAKED